MKKIEYQKPEMEIVKINTRNSLLVVSEGGGIEKDPDPVDY